MTIYKSEDTQPAKPPKFIKIGDTKLDHRWSACSIWTAGSRIGMFAIVKSKDGKLYPLEEWESSLASLDFGFLEVIKDWKKRFLVNKALINSAPELEGQKKRKHPIADLLPGLNCQKKASIEAVEGLIYFHYSEKKGVLDFQYYPGKAKLIERLKRLDKEESPIAMAFLQGVIQESSPDFIFNV